jgi:hypothetical protein
METLELTLTEFTRRSGSVLVKHGATSLRRGLEQGETVLVRDGASYRTATVADVTFELTDTHYRLVLGPVISEAEAFTARRDAFLGATDALGRLTGKVDTAELIALLRTARALRQQSASLALLQGSASR